jgi:hypothetical protein
MKQARIPNLKPEVLAVVIWATAVVAGAYAFVLGNWAQVQTWLAAAASLALIFVGYLAYSNRDEGQSTRWQSAVWLGTFLLVAFFLVRALIRQHV